MFDDSTARILVRTVLAAYHCQLEPEKALGRPQSVPDERPRTADLLITSELLQHGGGVSPALTRPGEPKTKKSRRTVRLTPDAVEALKRHAGRQRDEIEAAGDLYDDRNLE